jgi:hypothetical protein
MTYQENIDVMKKSLSEYDLVVEVEDLVRLNERAVIYDT